MLTSAADSASDVPAIDLEADIVLENLEPQELYRGKQRVFTGEEETGETGGVEVRRGIKPSHASMWIDKTMLGSNGEDSTESNNHKSDDN
jgi:hypothetical protein